MYTIQLEREAQLAKKSAPWGKGLRGRGRQRRKKKGAAAAAASPWRATSAQDNRPIRPSRAGFAAQVAGAAAGAQPPGTPGVPLYLRECPTCGRRFAPDRIERHKEACRRVSKKRKPFQSWAQRAVDGGGFSPPARSPMRRRAATSRNRRTRTTKRASTAAPMRSSRAGPTRTSYAAASTRKTNKHRRDLAQFSQSPTSYKSSRMRERPQWRSPDSALGGSGGWATPVAQNRHSRDRKSSQFVSRSYDAGSSDGRRPHSRFGMSQVESKDRTAEMVRPFTMNAKMSRVMRGAQTRRSFAGMDYLSQGSKSRPSLLDVRTIKHLRGAPPAPRRTNQLDYARAVSRQRRKNKGSRRDGWIKASVERDKRKNAPMSPPMRDFGPSRLDTSNRTSQENPLLSSSWQAAPH